MSTFVSFMLNIRLTNTDNELTFCEDLSQIKTFEDLTILIKKASGTQFEFDIYYYHENGPRLTLNNYSFNTMLQIYYTIDSSKRNISATQRSSSRSGSSFGSFNSSHRSFSGNSSSSGNELIVILEEISASQSSKSSQSSFKEGSQKQKVDISKAMHSFSKIQQLIESKILKKVKTLDYEDCENWYAVKDDGDVKLMVKHFLILEENKRLMKVTSMGSLNNSAMIEGVFNPTSFVSNSSDYPSNLDFKTQITKSLMKKYGNSVEYLNEGSYSYVFKVSDNGTTKAVKVILNSKESSDITTLNDALQEITRTVSLSHPNIIRIETPLINESPVYLYIVMEYFPLGDMKEIIENNIELTEPEVWRFIKQGALALVYLKQHNVVHRDIKPENFLQKDGTNGKEYVMSDFGLAKQMDNMNTTRKAGTPGYLAPELKQEGVKPYSSASDMFAFGVTLFRLLSFNRTEEVATISVTCKEETKLLAQIEEYVRKRTDIYSKRLLQLITKMVLHDPKERITAEDVLNVCENNTKCTKCGNYKASTCYLKGFSNCSCNELICKDCLETRMEDAISTMNSRSILKCSKCSNPFSESDIRMIVNPKTFETYTMIKNPPTIIQRPQVTNPQPQPQPSTPKQPQPQFTNPQPQREENNTKNYSINTIKHENITCDGCKQSEFTGIRWKCLSCHNYDLCNSCYQKRGNTSHRNHRFAKMEIFDSSFEDDIKAATTKLMLFSDHRGAIESLEKALSKYPLCEQALILKATCKEKLELFKDAKELCDKILNECNAYSVKACEILGRIYLKHNNPQNAITYLEKAVSIDSDSEICQYFLAISYQKEKKYRKALNPARIAFKLNSDEANTKLLGELLIQNEEWAEGKLMLSLALLKDPTNAELMYFLGLCEENTGDFVESLKSFREAISRDPFEIKYKIAADRVNKLLSIGLLGALLR